MLSAAFATAVAGLKSRKHLFAGDQAFRIFLGIGKAGANFDIEPAVPCTVKLLE